MRALQLFYTVKIRAYILKGILPLEWHSSSWTLCSVSSHIIPADTGARWYPGSSYKIPFPSCRYLQQVGESQSYDAAPANNEKITKRTALRTSIFMLAGRKELASGAEYRTKRNTEEKVASSVAAMKYPRFMYSVKHNFLKYTNIIHLMDDTNYFTSEIPPIYVLR